MKFKFRAVLLAAGKSTRMQGGPTKLLREFKGAPLITHIVQAVKDSGVDAKPALVVGHAHEDIKKVLGESAEYIYQAEQLGTGHAVKTAKELLEGQSENIIVLYGDHPLVKSETIRQLAEFHLSAGQKTPPETSPSPEEDTKSPLLTKEGVGGGPNVMTVTTMTMPGSGELEDYFHNFGRILRDKDGKFQGTREAKDLNDEEENIREVNTGYYAFKADWLWASLEKITNSNTQGEYYLTELDQIAAGEGVKVATFALNDPVEGIGINTPEQFELAQKL
jgi:bifunctional UDP-N-acetylglucosamine pyrophosphorylase / glucosamine-1-phosphate N-acetyltransferase